MRKMCKKLEQATIAKFTLYNSVKFLSRGLFSQPYTMGLLCNSNNTYQFVYIIETKNAFCTVLIPQALLVLVVLPKSSRAYDLAKMELPEHKQ